MEMFEGNLITSLKRDRSNLTAKLDLAAKTISKARRLVARARAKKQDLEEPTFEEVELESLLESDTLRRWGSSDSRRRDCNPNINSYCYCEHRRRRDSLLQTTEKDDEEQ